MFKSIAKIATGSLLALAAFASQASVFSCDATVAGDIIIRNNGVFFDLKAAPGGWYLDGGSFSLTNNIHLLNDLVDAKADGGAYRFVLYHPGVTDTRCSDNDEGNGTLLSIRKL